MVEPDVVVVPAGDALLGDPPRTEHVNVFAIARRPVTVGEYAMFVDETRHVPLWSGNRNEARKIAQWPACRGLTLSPTVAGSRSGPAAFTAFPTSASGRRPRGRTARSSSSAPYASGRSWQNGGRVLRTGEDLAVRLFAGADLKGIGFRIVRGMTGR